MSAWFRLNADIVDHPKMHRLATILNEPLAGWYVVKICAWLSRYQVRGLLAPGLAQQLERHCGWRGEPGKLTAALVESGLLSEFDNGYLELSLAVAEVPVLVDFPARGARQ